MKFEFDTVIDRSNTNAVAKEAVRGYLLQGANDLDMAYPDDELLPMWVADMAFASPPAATDAMIERIKHPIFGYTMVFDDQYFRAFHDWVEHRYGWTFEREELHLSPGVVPALYDLVELVCEPDEKVLTFTPAYKYFARAAEHHNRGLVTSGLIDGQGTFLIDFDDFRAKAADPKVRILFLCHPHNPTGRVWTEDELRKIGEICFENDVLVVSDEIHCDLLRNGRTHIPMAKLFPASDQIVTCMAPSKTFNLAGMQVANIIIPDPELRQAWSERHFPIVNPISMAAALGVYRDGHEWLAALHDYLDENLAEIKTHLQAHLPEARYEIPEATYLAWIDIGAYLPEGIDLTRFFAERAGVLLEGGEMFVADGGQRVRLNAACPRSMLRKALTRMVDAVQAYQQD